MEATKQTIVPSTKQLLDLKRGLQQTGTIWRCIQAGFIKGAITGQQAQDLQNELTNVVDYCQEQQKIIFQLQSQLAQSKQATLFN